MAFLPDYQALFEASPYPYMLMDRDKRIIGANRAYLKVTGTVASDLVGRLIFEAFPENEDNPESTNMALVRSSIERALVSRQPDAMPFVRYSIPCPGGGFEERYWSSVHTPVLDAEGEVAFISQNSLDVTDFYEVDRRSGRAGPRHGPAPGQEAGEQARTHAAMQRALLGERDYLRNLFNQSPGFMAVLAGPNHVFEMANEAYYALVGRRDIVGKPLWEALPDLRGQGFEELLDQVYRGGRPFVGRGIKAQIVREPGGPGVDAWIDLLYQPLFGKDGRVTGIFVQGHDVTETYEAQLARRDSEARLAEGLVAAKMVVWDWDIATRHIVLSDNAEQVLGMRADTLDEMAVPLVPEDAARLNAAHERAVAECADYVETL
ncbi:MAG TPA: PAS domain-containing protein, partial [Telluria sp.]|nr:PAS domain-containing protein [Telluria sp.]